MKFCPSSKINCLHRKQEFYHCSCIPTHALPSNGPYKQMDGEMLAQQRPKEQVRAYSKKKKKKKKIYIYILLIILIINNFMVESQKLEIITS